MFKGLLDKFRKGKSLDYDEAKTLAQDKDVKIRKEVAEHKDARPEILYYLAKDSSSKVRQAIATNESSPRQADLLLTNDKSVKVRSVLAKKISSLAPGLGPDEVDKIRASTYSALEALARDQATKVRQIVAETLKDMADAPPEVIRHLAEDTELVVCAPILENSPVLTEDDLLHIINLNPVEGAICAIAHRGSLPDEVMEEIFATNDTVAVSALLENASANIKEDLLERICDKSRTVKSLQEPLVHRPMLPKGVALRLADFVADHLIKSLLNRKDLDPETAAAVREEVSFRLDIVAEKEAASKTESLYAKAKRLFNEGNLEPGVVEVSLKAGQKEYPIAVLAVLSGLTVSTVEKIAAADNAKGIIALCWKAKLQPLSSIMVQKRLGRIKPNKVISPSNGGYSLTKDEMEWLLEFFSD